MRINGTFLSRYGPKTMFPLPSGIRQPALIHWLAYAALEELVAKCSVMFQGAYSRLNTWVLTTPKVPIALETLESKIRRVFQALGMQNRVGP